MLQPKYRPFPTLYLIALLAIAIGLPTAITRSHAESDKTLFVSTATRAGRLAVFDDVWETIQERYYDPTFRGLDWEATRVAFRPVAAEAKSTQDFYELLRRMIAPLKDPHTRVFSPEEKFDWWNPKFVTIGVSVREVEGSPIVVHVEPKSAANAAGGFVVVWGGDPGIRARRFDAAGVPASDEFQVNTYTTGAGLPAVAGLVTGGFVVVWQSSAGSGSDTSGEAVEAQRFDAAGMPVDGEFQVNTYTTSHQAFPAVAATGDGGFVAVWTSDGSGGRPTAPCSASAVRPSRSSL